MKIRSFISINLPEELLQPLLDYRRRLESVKAEVSWVKPESLHFTLKFLGEVEERRIQDISEAMSRAAAQCAPFQIFLDDKGVFPNWRRPRIVWLGSRHPVPQLQRLKDAIEDALAPLGFERESRPFLPHLTVGRVRSSRRLAELREKIENTPLVFTPFAVAAAHLMRSELKPSGAEYSRIADFGLRIAE